MKLSEWEITSSKKLKIWWARVQTHFACSPHIIFYWRYDHKWRHLLQCQLAILWSLILKRQKSLRCSNVFQDPEKKLTKMRCDLFPCICYNNLLCRFFFFFGGGSVVNGRNVVTFSIWVYKSYGTATRCGIQDVFHVWLPSLTFTLPGSEKCCLLQRCMTLKCNSHKMMWGCLECQIPLLNIHTITR